VLWVTRKGGSTGWTYFQVNGSTAVTLRVEDVTPGGDGCEELAATLQNAEGGTVDSALIGDNGASGMRTAKAGTYFLTLTVGQECSPPGPLDALVTLSPSGGLRGPVLKVSDLTLPKATVGMGLSINARTGRITGKPSRAGKYTFLVKITDSAKPAHHSVTDMFQISIS